MLKIDYNSYRSTSSFGKRVRFLVLHYTALNFRDSIKALTSSVSAHYLVPDPSEQTYIDAGFKGVNVFNIVDEVDRAWHAGVSSWSGRSNINDTSIGIETVSLAEDNHGAFNFPPFNALQVDAIKQLALNIIQRYPDITPTNVVGHSDIAVGRKSDPGAAFPWKELYLAGIGAWYDDADKLKYAEQFKANLPSKSEILTKLQRYGYDISGADSDIGYRNLLRAFQLHFRQSNYSGVLDLETASIIYALVDKYFS
ncbi:N-acetylmuramoyl-L-alanine amidase [Pseudomonas sp. PA15(2017)]|uniref:N-acetylmuramoyl-L-alanine amidase n=1 Tax=Pseudomonas sp. PA15(2017) TaxID=1932111 RepID=UPI000962F954|nr:N-acetylmuramoyl-L-alanine amidase [Pseudomonas sp. PA15(2017)]OLU22216.1 N-acetylmuramoyl-L-alanine amidase [Pseudomonas sp. PA15(2017)]